MLSKRNPRAIARVRPCESHAMQITRGRQFLHPVSLRRVTPAWRGSLRAARGSTGVGRQGESARARRFRAAGTNDNRRIDRPVPPRARARSQLNIDRVERAILAQGGREGCAWIRPARGSLGLSDFPLGGSFRAIRNPTKVGLTPLKFTSLARSDPSSTIDRSRDRFCAALVRSPAPRRIREGSFTSYEPYELAGSLGAIRYSTQVEVRGQVIERL